MIRIFFIILLIAFNIDNLNAQSKLLLTPYTPRLNKATVIEYLDDMKRFSGITLEYSQTSLNNQTIQLDSSEKSIGSVLQKVLNGQRIQLIEKNNKIILAPSAAIINTDELVPQYNLSGIVIADENKEPLSYARIVASRNGAMATTNAFGIYNFRLPQGKHRLIISDTGFQSIVLDIDIYNDQKKDISLVKEKNRSYNFLGNLSNKYKTSIGLKFYPEAITIKHFYKNDRAIEGLVYFWSYGIRLTGLYEIHKNFRNPVGLKWYYGPGAHIGYWNQNWEDEYPDRSNRINVGVDGVIGLDYKINKVPINLSLDWQPSLNLIGYSYFESGWGGFSIRYTLK